METVGICIMPTVKMLEGNLNQFARNYFIVLSLIQIIQFSDTYLHYKTLATSLGNDSRIMLNKLNVCMMAAGWIQACGHSHGHSSPATKTATASTGSSDDLRPSPTTPMTCIQLLVPRSSSTSLLVSCCG